MAAIDQHGPTAGIAEIARAAGVSKPVLYRYFEAKADLYRAVGHWGADQVLAAIVPVLRGRANVRDKIDRGCRNYLKIIDAHPNVFFLLIGHHSSSDPLAGESGGYPDVHPDTGTPRLAAVESRSVTDLEA